MTTLTYSNQNGYQVPNLKMDGNEDEAQTLSRFGRAREKYLMEHRKGLYNSMLLTGRLWPHLLEIDRAAQAQMDELTKAMAEEQGVTEARKAANQMAWVQKMNNIRQSAEEIVRAELIYS